MQGAFARAAHLLREAGGVRVDVVTPGEVIADVPALRYDEEAHGFTGDRRPRDGAVSFEVGFDRVADRPEKGWRLAERSGERCWSVTSARAEPENGAWVVSVVETRA